MSIKSLKLKSKIIQWPVVPGQEPLYQGLVYNRETEAELDTLIAALKSEDISPDQFKEQHLFLVLAQAGEDEEEAKKNLSSLLRRIANQLRKRL